METVPTIRGYTIFMFLPARHPVGRVAATCRHEGFICKYRPFWSAKTLFLLSLQNLTILHSIKHSIPPACALHADREVIAGLGCLYRDVSHRFCNVSAAGVAGVVFPRQINETKF
jgi:hypothetical protein